MKTKKHITIMLLAVMLSLTGCEKTDKDITDKDITDKNITDKDITDSDQASGYNFQTTFCDDSYENVKFDTELIFDVNINSQPLYQVKATLCKPDHEKSIDKLMQGIEIVDKYEPDTGNGSVYLYGEDNTTFHVSNKSVYISRPFSSYITNAFRLEKDDEYNGNLYLTGEEFAFMNVESAYGAVTDVLSDIGFDIGENRYTCYSLDYETLSQNEYAIDVDGKEDASVYKDIWTKEDNSYYFCIFQACQGMIVYYPYADCFTKIEDANAPIQVLYSSQGIQLLDVDRVFNFEQNDTKIELLDFDKIAETIAFKYNMLLTETTYTVESARLFWRPIPETDSDYDMVPAWDITIVDDKEGGISKMYVDAVTAKEIL